MPDVAEAIDLLNQVITLHQGHIDGSVPADQASMETEMELLEAALSALTGDSVPSKDRRLIGSLDRAVRTLSKFR